MSVPADVAVRTIKSNLDQGIFDWDVTHDQLIIKLSDDDYTRTRHLRRRWPQHAIATVSQ